MGSGNRFEEIGGGLSVEVSDDHGFTEDALLLARFASSRPDDHVCDLGTGCGIIPLFWCRNHNPPVITAVEIQKQAAEMAERSVDRSGMSGRVKVYHADLRDWRIFLKPGSQDVVTMNPPYFTPGSGGKSKTEAARIARHEGEGCTFQDAAQAASGLLRTGGRFCFCHRPERLCDVFAALRGIGLEPKKLRFLHAKADAAPWLFLCEARKGGSQGVIVLPPFIRNNPDGSPTSEQITLYNL